MKKYTTLGLITILLTTASAFAMDTMHATDTMMAPTSTMMHDDKMDGKMMETMDYESITMHSKTEDISKLQMMLIEKGYLKMPKNVKHGYYGNLTKKAFMKYKNAKMMTKGTTTY